jgi:hypothetical protein
MEFVQCDAFSNATNATTNAVQGGGNDQMKLGNYKVHNAMFGGSKKVNETKKLREYAHALLAKAKADVEKKQKETKKIVRKKVQKGGACTADPVNVLANFQVTAMNMPMSGPSAASMGIDMSQAPMSVVANLSQPLNLLPQMDNIAIFPDAYKDFSPPIIM